MNAKSRRTTPLLEYIKNRKLEKQVRSDFCLKFHIYVSCGFQLDNLQLIIIELFREYEKRKEKNEGGENWRKSVCGRKRKGNAEKKKDKPEKGDELASEKHKEKGEEADIEENKWDKSPGSGNQRDLERRFREKEPERQRYRLDDGRKHRTHYEFDKFMRRNEEELKWGKGYNQDRGKKGNYNYSFTVEAVDKLGKEDKCDDMASKKERIRNKSAWSVQGTSPGPCRTHCMLRKSHFANTESLVCPAFCLWRGQLGRMDEIYLPLHGSCFPHPWLKL
uniref:UPF3A regulator of nonsense mediated mRNA decay n=1 Tax=Malurus cyaneus samueli TaxID=2593467 RepID=A0A8C5TKI4_9PASS